MSQKNKDFSIPDFEEELQDLLFTLEEQKVDRNIKVFSGFMILVAILLSFYFYGLCKLFCQGLITGQRSRTQSQNPDTVVMSFPAHVRNADGSPRNLNNDNTAIWAVDGTARCHLVVLHSDNQSADHSTSPAGSGSGTTTSVMPATV